MVTTVAPQGRCDRSHPDRERAVHDLRNRLPILYRQKRYGPIRNQVLDLPILATIYLLSSSVTVVLAERAFRRGHAGGFRLWWLITILLAAAFLGSTALEWQRLIFRDHLTISTNLFGTTFYSLVGLHASHVIVGSILLVLVLILSLRGYVTRAHAEHVEMLSWYWHFVDGIWIIVFTVVYIIGR